MTSTRKHWLTIPALMAVLVVAGLAAWWTIGFAPAYGQGSDSENTSSTTTTVQAPWGSITADGSDDITQGFIKSSGQSSGSDNDRTRQPVTNTPIPTSAITRYSGIVKVSWSLDANIEDPDTYRFRVERQYTPRSGNPGEWRVLSESHSGESYRDYDVGAYSRYEYRVTPIAPDGTKLQTVTVRQTTGFRSYLQGFGTASGVQLTVRGDKLTPYEDQRVTITRYDHTEMNSGEGHVVVTHRAFPAGVSYMTVPDTTAVAGTVYYYKVEYYLADPNSGVISPMQIDVAPVAIMAIMVGVVPPTTPDAPTVEAGTVAGTVKASWTVTDDNKQAGIYEVYRRPIKPINADPPTTIGTTFGQTLTYKPEDIAKNYEYSVRPISIQGMRGSLGSHKVYPVLQPPGCHSYQFPDQNTVAKIIAAQDMIGDESTNSYDPRIIDIRIIGYLGAQCQNVNPDDYYLKKRIFYAHTKSSVLCTADPSSSCTTIKSDRPTAEPVYNVRSHRWGFHRYTWLAFYDDTVPAGEYDITYNVCMTGFDLCSNAVRTGRILLGVDAVPFMVDVPEQTPLREYPAGVSVYE